MSRVLIAGLGNVFRGDDAFGVEVVTCLRKREFPPEVDIVDFGINGIDLVYALLDRYDAALLFDTLHRDGAPGALYVIEPEFDEDAALDAADLMLTPHALDPAKVLRTVHAMDGRCRRIVLVGCEPAEFGDEWEGKAGLSTAVAAAVATALAMAAAWVDRLLMETTSGRAARPPPARAVVRA